jgi:hypothetical protein
MTMSAQETATPPRSFALSRWVVILFVGAAALAVYFLVAPTIGHHASGYYRPRKFPFSYGYNRPLLLLFIPYALALIAWRRGARIGLGWLLGGAAVLHLALLFAPLPQSQDMYQYLLYGRMQLIHPSAQLVQANPQAMMPFLHGMNPYTTQPVAIWVDSWYSWIHWPLQTSVYGPVWSLLSLGVAKAAGSSITTGFLLYKLVVLALDAAIVTMIVFAWRWRGDASGRDGQGAGWGVLAYAWNPLVLITVPLGGLVDVAVAACLLGAYLARRRGRMGLATVLLTVASLIKVYAVIGLVLHLVLLLRDRGIRTAAKHGAMFAGIAAVLSVPYWAGIDTFRGLFHVADLSNKSLAGTVQKLLTPVLGGAGVPSPGDAAGAIVRWVGVGLLAWVVIWAIRRVRTEDDLWLSVLAVLSVYFLVTPWFLYWYLLAPLVLIAAMPRNRFTVPVLAFSGTSLITAAFPPWLAGQAVQALARYGPPVAIYMRGAPKREPVDDLTIDSPPPPAPALAAEPIPAG